LDILICRYHLGATVGLADRALALASELPPLARIACWGLAVASAYKADDLDGAKKVACTLATEIISPWDLPTVPTFVQGVGEKVIVTETSSVDFFLEIIRALRSRSVNTTGEIELLDSLAQRYEARGAA